MIGPRLVAGLALVVGLSASACSSSDSSGSQAGAQPRPSAPASVATTTTTVAPLLTGEPPIVAVLGDSNIYFAIPALEASFADAGLRSTIRGIAGSGVKDIPLDWAPAAAQIRATPPAVVVVALGTNDAAEPENVAAFGQRLEALLAELGDVPVVWVTHTEGGVQHPPEAERAVNDEIRAGTRPASQRDRARPPAEDRCRRRAPRRRRPPLLARRGGVVRRPDRRGRRPGAGRGVSG